MAALTLTNDNTEPAPLRGDESELFRRNHARLLRMVRRDTGAPEAVAEDAVCFAFLQLCRRQPERGLQTVGWLRVVARHEAFRLLCQQWRCVSLDDSGPGRPEEQMGELVPLVERIAGPADVERSHEVREALRAVAGLRWRRRRVIALRLAGYSYKEIAERLGVTYTNVNRHITEGRAELRQLREAA